MVILDTYFEDMLISFCKEDTFEKEFFKSISIISESAEDNPESVVSSDFKILFFDKLCDDVYDRIKSINKNASKHKSVDGLYFIKENNILKLYFIEFKHINSGNRGRSKLKKITKPELKLKALESLFCVLPNLIEYYCGEESVNFIQSQLIDIPKYYISVLKDRGNINNNNEHEIVASDFLDMERLSKYPFEKSIVVSPKTFEGFLRKKFYTNPLVL